MNNHRYSPPAAMGIIEKGTKIRVKGSEVLSSSGKLSFFPLVQRVLAYAHFWRVNIHILVGFQLFCWRGSAVFLFTQWFWRKYYLSWAEHKKYKYHWYFIFVLRARSGLYRRRSLQVNTSTNFWAFFEIYKMCILLHRSNLSNLAKRFADF